MPDEADRPIVTAFSFRIPLPYRACSPNTREHWRQIAKEKAAYRAECRAIFGAASAGLAGFGPLRFPLTWSAVYYLGRPRTDREHLERDGRYFPKDEDNGAAALKAALDALADAHIVPVDSKKYLRLGSVTLLTRAKEHKGRAEVVLTLTPSEN